MRGNHSNQRKATMRVSEIAARSPTHRKCRLNAYTDTSSPWTPQLCMHFVFFLHKNLWDIWTRSSKIVSNIGVKNTLCWMWNTIKKLLSFLTALSFMFSWQVLGLKSYRSFYHRLSFVTVIHWSMLQLLGSWQMRLKPLSRGFLSCPSIGIAIATYT